MQSDTPATHGHHLVVSRSLGDIVPFLQQRCLKLVAVLGNWNQLKDTIIHTIPMVFKKWHVIILLEGQVMKFNKARQLVPGFYLGIICSFRLPSMKSDVCCPWQNAAHTIPLRSTMISHICNVLTRDKSGHFRVSYYWPDHEECLWTDHTYWPPVGFAPWHVWVEIPSLRLSSISVAKWCWTTGFEQNESLHKQIHQKSEKKSWHCVHHFKSVCLYFCWADKSNNLFV